MLRILAGAAAGIAIEYLSKLLADRLLVKRGKEAGGTKQETVFLSLFSCITGAAILYLGSSVWESVYLLLLLVLSETIALTDIRARIIPNECSLAILGLTLLFGIPSLLGANGFPSFSLLRSLLGFAVCFLLFLFPAAFSKQVGAGDVKLAAAMGFCLGLKNSLFGIVLMGILVLGYLLFQKRAALPTFLKSMIPMGPFLSCSLVLVPLLAKLPAAGAYLDLLPF